MLEFILLALLALFITVWICIDFIQYFTEGIKKEKEEETPSPQSDR